jgi:hypothetical protein
MSFFSFFLDVISLPFSLIKQKNIFVFYFFNLFLKFLALFLGLFIAKNDCRYFFIGETLKN